MLRNDFSIGARPRWAGPARAARGPSQPSAVRASAACFVLGSSNAELLDHDQLAAGQRVGQRRAERALHHLLVDALVVVAHDRAVGHAAADPLGRADRALARAAGALLAPRLLPAAADLAARLDLVRAGAQTGHRRHDHLVHQRHVHRRLEDGRRAGRASRSSCRRRPRCRSSPCSRSLRHPCLQRGLDGRAHHHEPAVGAGDRALDRAAARARGRTGPPRGSAPSCAGCPSWPAIRMPLNTRLGVAHAPIAPGERCFLCTPWPPPRPANPWRFITPENPLPFETPTTSTLSPTAKESTVTSWPAS